MPAVARPALGSTEWVLLVVLSVLWGGSFFFTELALAELPPLVVVQARVTLAAAALLLMVRAGGLALPTDAAGWGRLAVMGLLNNALPFCLIVWGQTRIEGGLAAILNAATPLFTVLVAHAATRDEALSAGRLAGVIVGFGGVALMIGPAALAGLGQDVAAQLAVLGGALSYACAGVYGRRFRGQPPLVTAAGQVTASALLLLPVTLLVDRPWELAVPGAATLAAVAGSALASTALAYVLFFRILAAAGATNVVLVTFLVPVSAVLLGAAFLGERLDAEQILGMGVIALGLACIDGRPVRAALRRLRPRPST